MGARRQIGKLRQDPGEELPTAQATATVVVDSGCFICLFWSRCAACEILVP